MSELCKSQNFNPLLHERFRCVHQGREIFNAVPVRICLSLGWFFRRKTSTEALKLFLLGSLYVFIYDLLSSVGKRWIWSYVRKGYHVDECFSLWFCLPLREARAMHRVLHAYDCDLSWELCLFHRLSDHNTRLLWTCALAAFVGICFTFGGRMYL